MSQTHWKKLGDPNFLGGYDFEDGEQKTLTIKSVENTEAFNPGDKKKETVRTCFFKENIKPMILNATNAKTLENLYKSGYVENWVGRKFIVHFDKNVKAGREVVGGLRILPFLPQSKSNEPAKCFDCHKEIEPAGNMSAAQMAEYTQKRFGKPLCAECATKLKQELSKKKEDVLNENNENND